MVLQNVTVWRVKVSFVVMMGKHKAFLQGIRLYVTRTASPCFSGPVHLFLLYKTKDLLCSSRRDHEARCRGWSIRGARPGVGGRGTTRPCGHRPLCPAHLTPLLRVHTVTVYSVKQTRSKMSVWTENCLLKAEGLQAAGREPPLSQAGTFPGKNASCALATETGVASVPICFGGWAWGSQVLHLHVNVY